MVGKIQIFQGVSEVRRVCWGFLLVALGLAPLASGQIVPERRTVLESIELRGTDRVDAQDLADELGIKPGDSLNDAFVTSARARILSLGLFRSCFLSLKKGSAPGKARLIVMVEEDDGVLGPWAMGGTLGMTYGETKTASSGLGGSPLGYRFNLIGRNILRSMHRASLGADVDGLGKLRAGQLAYGLPRFTTEGVQFDAEVNVVDPSRRYLDTLGFGARSQAMWNRNWGAHGLIRYGVSMLLNQRDQFRMPGYPGQVAGPKVGYSYEGRLLRFFPGEGSHGDVSLLLSPRDQRQATAEAGLAHTISFQEALYWTLDARGIVSGAKSRGLRCESRFDLPLGDRPGEAESSDAGLFLRLRSGSDLVDGGSVQGTAALFGLRYHSDGFIAEVALQITKSPEELSGGDTERKSSANSDLREGGGW